MLRNRFSGRQEKFSSTRSDLKIDGDHESTLFESGNAGEKDSRPNGINPRNLKIKPKKFKHALTIPIICNMNPRSVYNKIDEFHEFVEQEEVDLLFMSESWEIAHLTLDQIIKLEDHEVISNVSKRVGVGVALP